MEEQNKFKALEPRRLVMTTSHCFYCDKYDEDNMDWYLVDILFGIKCCKEHKILAERDCKAYMHLNKMVHMNNALENPQIKKFIEYLGNDIQIKRTNGSIDNGWTIKKSDFDSIASLSVYKDKGWSVTMEKVINGDLTNKRVTFSSLLDPELKYSKDNEFTMLYHSAMSELDHGLYIEHYLTQPKTQEFLDGDYITTIEVDGKKVRVYNPV